jgi:Ca2+-binding EF-hand superfamily protein
MERKKQTNPTSGKYYTEKDFVLGATTFLAGFKFMLVKADEYTEKYMEDNTDAFPQASMDAIIAKIKKGSKGYPNLQEYAIFLMKTLDRNNDGFVDSGEFTQALQTLNIFCTKHEEHALLRRFDANGDGKISMEEFYNILALHF